MTNKEIAIVRSLIRELTPDFGADMACNVSKAFMNLRKCSVYDEDDERVKDFIRTFVEQKSSTQFENCKKTDIEIFDRSLDEIYGEEAYNDLSEKYKKLYKYDHDNFSEDEDYAKEYSDDAEENYKVDHRKRLYTAYFQEERKNKKDVPKSIKLLLDI